MQRDCVPRARLLLYVAVFAGPCCADSVGRVGRTPIVGSVTESVLSRSFYLCFFVFFSCFLILLLVAMTDLQCLFLLSLLCFL